jgi:hypothetical protein
VNAWKAICAALVIFAAGVVTGGLTVSVRPPVEPPVPSASNVPALILPQHRVEYLRRLQRQLDLTPPQHSRIESLLKESQERMRKAWEPIAPAAREEARQVRRQIVEELTPEQRKKFEEMTRARTHKGTNDLSEPRRLKRDDRRNSTNLTKPQPPTGALQ